MTNRQIIHFRRKREGKTDYKKRLEYLKSGKPRLVVRKTVNNTIVSIVEYHPDGDKIITTFNSKDLKKLGWSFSTGNIPAAYLAGFIAAKKALERNVSNAILDLGLQSSVKKGRLFAALKGALDAGLDIPHSEEAFPSEDRILGKHIESYLNVKLSDKVEEIKSKF
jgi:large subunit ribosomal protein L18